MMNPNLRPGGMIPNISAPMANPNVGMLANPLMGAQRGFNPMLSNPMMPNPMMPQPMIPNRGFEDPQALLIQRVMSLTPEQILQLPPEQQNQVRMIQQQLRNLPGNTRV